MTSIIQIEEDILKTIKELEDIKIEITNLNQELKLIQELISTVNQNDIISKDKMLEIGIDPTQIYSPTILKLKLRGIQNTKKTRLNELQIGHNKNKQLINHLTKCPICQGKGTTTKTSYDRNDNRITPTTKTETCPTCQGKGQLNINSQILELLKKIK
ncbi:hypothetical protein JW865_00835 [Candidatus Bathyarchaeota archaeon]|nr:hypothetical protein [Candidatus Bathyarchaeota archaeon]